MISFEDIRPQLKKFVQEDCETADYIMRVSKTPKDGVYAYEELQPLVRCRDCRFATISTMGFCKYCEMFVLPDVDGYGADPQVNLPLDFFCAWGERRDDD